MHRVLLSFKYSNECRFDATISRGLYYSTQSFVVLFNRGLGSLQIPFWQSHYLPEY